MSDEQKALPKASEMDTEVIEGIVEAADEQKYMSETARKVNALSEKAWRAWQIAGGIVVGLACAASLFLLESTGFLPLNLIVAFLIAKIVPSYVEKQLERSVNAGRVALLIALAGALVGYLIYHWASGSM